MSEETKQAINNKDQDSSKIVQLVGFIVGDEEFAVPILSIQEIIKPLEYSRVPGTPDYVFGVFNLRGNVIPLINLRLKFGMLIEPQTEDTRYIVIKHENDVAGFVIDKLTEAVRIKESEIEAAPETNTEEVSLIDGVAKKEDRLITILRISELLKRTF